MSASQLLVGYASATLTVPDPVHLLGQFHMRLNTGVQDDVAAQVMFLGNDADSVIFVSIDTEEIQPYLVTEVQRKVHLRNARIPVESLLLHATHTHARRVTCGTTIRGWRKRRSFLIPATSYPPAIPIGRK